jgi:hypothetical protein
MTEREERQQHQNAPQQTVKPSPFWPQAPALWFAQAECSFTVKKIEAQLDRYCHVVAALPHESLRLVADLVESPPTKTPYNDIKNRLVASHQLSDFQKAERLFLMPPLGSRKPSEMMAAMLETCPRGEEKTNLFACIFLQRLPERSGSCWQEWITRTRRSWLSRQTSCGLYMTTTAAAPSPQFSRTAWREILSPPCRRATGSIAEAAAAAAAVDEAEGAAGALPRKWRSRRPPRRPG